MSGSDQAVYPLYPYLCQVPPRAVLRIGLVSHIPCFCICVWESTRAVLVWCHVYPVSISVFECRHLLYSVLVWCHVSLVSVSVSIASCRVGIWRSLVSVITGSLLCKHVEARCLILVILHITEYCIIAYFIVWIIKVCTRRILSCTVVWSVKLIVSYSSILSFFPDAPGTIASVLIKVRAK